MEFENNRVVAVKDVPSEEIKKDIVGHLKDELQLVEDFEEMSFHNAIAKRFLQESKYKLVDAEDGTATLSKTDGQHNVRITFKTYEQMQEEDVKEEPTEGEEEEGEMFEEGEGEGEHKPGEQIVDADSPSTYSGVAKTEGEQQQAGRQPRKQQEAQEEEGEGEELTTGDEGQVQEGMPEGEPLPNRQDFIVDIEFLGETCREVIKKYGDHLKYLTEKIGV